MRLGRRLPAWNTHGKFSSIALHAVHRNRPGVQLNCALDNGQAQPGSSNIADVCATVKTLEQPRNIALRNPDT
jgi:hypothetical protein